MQSLDLLISQRYRLSPHKFWSMNRNWGYKFSCNLIEIFLTTYRTSFSLHAECGPFINNASASLVVKRHLVKGSFLIDTSPLLWLMCTKQGRNSNSNMASVPRLQSILQYHMMPPWYGQQVFCPIFNTQTIETTYWRHNLLHLQSGMENGNLWYNLKYKKNCEKKVTSMKKDWYRLLKQWGEYIINYRLHE